MKTKKLFNKMVVIILGMLLLAGIGVCGGSKWRGCNCWNKFCDV